MEVGDILRLFVIVSGVFMVVGVILSLAKRKMTEPFCLAWVFLFALMILSGALLNPSQMKRYVSTRGLILTIIIVSGVLWGLWFISMQVSILKRKNQELAMQVSLLNNDYEKIIKEDFLCHLEEGLDEWETDALLSYPQPLAALYTEWMGVDYSYLDIDRIQSTAKQAAGKRLNELRRHEFDVNGEPPAELRYFYDLHSEILDNPDLEWVGDMEP